VDDTGTVNNASFEAVDVDSKYTIAEDLKYKQRYEEGYDLPDPCYEEWLRSEAASRSMFNLSSPNLNLAFEAGRISTVQLSNSLTSVSVSNDSSDCENSEDTTPTPEPVCTIEEQLKY